MQDHAYDDQKARATRTIYQTNFQAVSNKLLHTKLEDLESIPSASSPQAVKGLQPTITLREIAGQEQILIDQSYTLKMSKKSLDWNSCCYIDPPKDLIVLNNFY